MTARCIDAAGIRPPTRGHGRALYGRRSEGGTEERA